MTWKQQHSGTQVKLRKIYFATNMIGIAVGDEGTLITTEDGGITWKRQNSGTTKNLRDISVSEDKLFAVGDDGLAIEYKIPMISKYRPRKLLFDEPEIIPYEPEIVWENLFTDSAGNLRNVFFIDDSHGWSVGENGAILHTTNGGRAWEKQNCPIDNTLIGLYFITPKLGWIMSRDASFLSTSDGGKTWRIINADSKPLISRYDSEMNSTKVAYNLKAVYFQSSSEGWAVGEDGAILHNIDGGPVWTAQDSKHNTTFNDIQFTNDNIGWAVGLWGTIVFTNDAGKNWFIQSSDTSYDLKGLHFINDKEGWVVGRDGIILHTHNSGADWLSQYSGVDENLNSVYFKNNKEGWIAGEKGLILHTQDGGLLWQREGSGTNKNLYDIYYNGKNLLVAVGAECTIIKQATQDIFP